jgi:hypothetical protein
MFKPNIQKLSVRSVISLGLVRATPEESKQVKKHEWINATASDVENPPCFYEPVEML